LNWKSALGAGSGIKPFERGSGIIFKETSKAIPQSRGEDKIFPWGSFGNSSSEVFVNPEN
jgi:hypothetical protein